MKKIALISHVLPPSPSGQSVMLYRIFRDISPDRYCLVSRVDHRQIQGPTPRLAGTYHTLPDEWRFSQPALPVLRLGRDAINVFLRTSGRTRSLTEVLRREKCDCVLACTGDVFDITAGFLAARKLGIPFYPYVFDYFAYQFVDPAARMVSACVERYAFPRAAGIAVNNEFMRDEYRRRLGMESVVVRNPIETVAGDEVGGSPWPAQPGRVRVVYTGALYEAHWQAVDQFVTAMGLLDGCNVVLEIYSEHHQSAAKHLAGRPNVLVNPPVPLSEVRGLQRSADILLLPLAFQSPYPQLVRTASPSKMGDYLASGRPVLVIAPPDSYVAWYYRTHGCAIVVENSDPAPLAAAIRTLIEDAEGRRRMVQRGLERAHTDFSIPAARAALLSLIDGPPAS